MSANCIRCNNGKRLLPDQTCSVCDRTGSPTQPCPECGGKGRVIDLRKARIAAGLNLSEMSRLSGYSVSYLSEMERGIKQSTKQIRAFYAGSLRYV